MAWIDGDSERIFYLDLDIEEVTDFFCDPKRFSEAFLSLAEGVELESDVWRYTLEPISAGGVSFQGTYIVEYRREENAIFWSSRPDENMKSEGKTVVSKVGSRVQVEYQEKVSTNLPIPRLAAKLFRPIVANEVKKGIDLFLDEAISILSVTKA